MTSAIVSSTIDANFPVAGQDNDSQGFRDNFSVIKDGLATAGSEISDLQQYTAKVNADNNFQGKTIFNAKTNTLYGTVYTASSTALTNISLENGEYQVITVGGNHTLTFTDWPDADLYAKLRLELKNTGGGNYNVIFASGAGGTIRKEITQSLAEATGVVRASTSVSATATKFSYPTANQTAGAFSSNDVLYGTGLTGEVVVSSVSNLTTTTNQTTAPFTRTYTSITSNGRVNTSQSTASLVQGDKVRLSDTTGIGGLSTTATYYIYNKDVSGFYIASSAANADAGTPVAGLDGTATYTAIDGPSARITSLVGGTVPVGDAITFDDITGLTGMSTSTTYYAYNCNSTGFNIAETFANATALTPVPLAGVTGTFTNGSGTATFSGSFAGTGTATFAENNITNSNGITVGSTTGMFVNMPVAFTGTTFGNIASAVYYYVIAVIDSTHIRVSATSGGVPLTLTTASGSMAMVPRTVVNVTMTASQTVSAASGLTITTADTQFPTPFQLTSDVNKRRIVEAWSSDGGANIFLKYLGEYA